MNFYNRHLGDYARRTRHLSTYQHGVMSQLLDDYYVTEQGIPKHLVYDLVRAKKPSEKKEVNSVLEQFFFLSEDGETWLNSRAEEEIAAFHASDKHREQSSEKKSGIAMRQERSRAERKALFNEARNLGIHLPFDSTMKTIRELINDAKISSNGVTDGVTVTASECDSHATVTANQTPEANNQTPEANNQTHSTVTETSNGDVTVTPSVTDTACVVTHSETVPETLPPSTKPTPADVCRVLKAMKISTVNPSHPDLQLLLKAGIGIDDFVANVPTALTKTHPFNYLLGTLKGQLQQAQQAISDVGSKSVVTAKTKQTVGYVNKQKMLEQSNQREGEDWEKMMLAQMQKQKAEGVVA